MSNPGLVFQVADPQAAHGLDDEVVEFVGIGAAAVPGDAFAAVDRAALGVGRDERLVARLLDMARDFLDGLVPTNVFPMIGPGRRTCGFKQAPLVLDVLQQRRALGDTACRD